MGLRDFSIAGAFLLLCAAVRAAPPADHRTAQFEGSHVRYVSRGAGREAVVLVHGWACSAELWQAQLEAFPGRRVIAVDLPGHGLSDKPRVAYSLAYFARAIDAVLRDAKVGRAVLVGHSMGAPIVAKFAGLYPKKTAGLVFVDGALRPFMSKEKMDKTLADLRGGYASSAPAMIASWLEPVSDDNLKSRILSVMLATPDYVGIGAMEGMADAAGYERGPLKAPALAMLAESHGWQPEDFAYLRSVAPNVDIKIWPGVSHFLMMERPKEFEAAVSAFLKKNRL